jgi:AcrR family transcriptional regulator
MQELNEPRQRRSRESQERILRATERIMMRLGTADFSIPDVTEEAGLSIGGIYRRFEDKEALVCAVQERLYDRMSEDYAKVEAAALRQSDSLRGLVGVLVPGLANLLKRHAPMIKAIMEATWSYPAVAKRGVEEFEETSKRFKALLLLQRKSIRHPNPGFAAQFCFICVFELVASHFGVGRRAAPEHTRWPDLLSELQRLCFHYLDGRGSMRASRRR